MGFAFAKWLLQRWGLKLDFGCYCGACRRHCEQDNVVIEAIKSIRTELQACFAFLQLLVQ